jgi:6-phosphogluconolactonase
LFDLQCHSLWGGGFDTLRKTLTNTNLEAGRGVAGAVKITKVNYCDWFLGKHPEYSLLVSTVSRKSRLLLATRENNRFCRLTVIALLAAFLLPLCARNAKADGKTYIVYIGTYTYKTSKGIYGYRFSPSTGEVAPLGLLAETAHPTWLAVHPNQRFLYAANEHGKATEPGNTITAFAIDTKTAQLTFLNEVATGGDSPAQIAIDKTGKILVACNVNSGSFAVFPIHPDGRLGEASDFIQHHGSSVDPERQTGPHPHSAVFSPDNRFVIIADRGVDRVFVYHLNYSTATLEPNEPAFVTLGAGWGPRHLAFHPNGKYLYLIHEMGSRLTTFDYDAASGTLKETQTISTLPDGFSGYDHSAELQVDRAGRFVYGSNRGDDSIGVFAVNASTGALTPIQHVSTQGKTPRNFSLDPTGTYLFAANQDSDSVVMFRVNHSTGKLTPTGKVLKDSPEPTCIVFVPAR